MTEDEIFARLQASREEGFEAAIRALRNPDRDEFNAGNTRCIHSDDWAKWLEINKAIFCHETNPGESK